MKVVSINGSPRKEGNTYHALKMVGDELNKEGITVDIIQIGDQRMQGCLGCGNCARNKDERCVIDDDVNDAIQKMKVADGVLLGSPVHYAGVGGTMKSFLDRVFMVAGERWFVQTQSGSICECSKTFWRSAGFQSAQHLSSLFRDGDSRFKLLERDTWNEASRCTKG
ncbi:MAG: flavodoxin family protein [Thermotogota bacterium]